MLNARGNGCGKPMSPGFFVVIGACAVNQTSGPALKQGMQCTVSTPVAGRRVFEKSNVLTCATQSVD